MLEFYFKSNSILSNQSGFKRGDSCVYQFSFIIHEIYQAFDNGFEVRDIFLEIFKDFDLLNILSDFLKERKQRVVFNDQHSKWSNISAGLSKEWILRSIPLLI